MFKINKSKDNQFYVTLVAKNGEILNNTEMFKTRASARKNIKAVIKLVQAGPLIIDNTL